MSPPTLNLGNQSKTWQIFPSSFTKRNDNSNTLLSIVNSDNHSQHPISFSFVCCSKFSRDIAAIDQRGILFLFQLDQNKYSVLAKFGVSGTCVTFGGADAKQEIYVALSDGTIASYDGEKHVKKLASHRNQTIIGLSSHPSHRIILSYSDRDVVLWDTLKWKKLRVLSGANEHGIHQACFSPHGDFIVALFKNATIVFWSSDNLAPIWKINLDPSDTNKDKLKQIRTHSAVFDLSKDEVFLAVSSPLSQSSIFVWNISSKSLIHEIMIPSFDTEHGIEKIRFIGTSSNLAVLSGDGEMIIVDAFDGKLVTKVNSQETISKFDIAHDGNSLAAIMKTASLLKLWNLDLILNPPSTQEQPASIIENEEYPSTSMVDDKKKISMAKRDIEKISSLDPRNALNFNRLKQYLLHFGEFPEKYRRILVWRFLLQVPENREAYDALVRKKIHPSLKLFRNQFPLKSERLGREMESIMSCLIFWSPIFENLDYLPSLIFPFAKVFQSDKFACFEGVLTIFTNWCNNWWEFYPNPPIQVLDTVEDLLEHHDKRLLGHFKRCHVSSQIYAWSIFSSMFSDVFCRKDWLVIWDHIFMNSCEFIYFILVAFLKTFRVSLFKIDKMGDFKFFFSRNVSLNVSKLVTMAYELEKSTPDALKPRNIKFQPLPKGHYPIFNKYPEHIVNYQKKLRERIRSEEEEYLRKKKVSADISKFADELRKENKTWENVEGYKSDMLEKWWADIIEEEERHLDRRVALEAEENEKRMKALAEANKTQKDFEFSRKTQDETRRLFSEKVKQTALSHQRKEQEASQMEDAGKMLKVNWEQKLNSLRGK